jgi:GTP-binding protein
MLVAANKTDLPDSAENLARLKEKLGDSVKVFPVSAATRKGFEDLMRATVALLRTLPAAEPFVEEEFFEEPALEPFAIRKENGIYVLSGPSMERLVNSVNFGDEDSLNWFHRTLRRWGVIDALREAGAGEGDTVSIDDMQFDFVE